MPKPNKNEAKGDFLKRCTAEVISVEGKDAEEAFAACNLAWDNEHSLRSVMTFALPFELKKGDEESNPSFMITAYTGAPIERYWGEIIFDIEGMQTKQKIPVLREHQRDRVVGFGKSFKDENNLYVSGDFSQSTSDAKEVLSLAEEGYPWQASVGIWPLKVKLLENSKSKETVNGREISGPAEIWLESEVGEVSFVSLAADSDTSAINLTESASKVPVEIVSAGKPLTEETIMDYTLALLEKDAPELLADIREESHQAGLTEGQDAGVKMERERVLEILGADGDATVSKDAITDGTAAPDVFKLFFKAEKAKRSEQLADLEEEAPDSAGHEDPIVKDEDNRAGDVIIAEKAAELASEKGISIADAMIQVMNDNPDLLAKYEKTYERE